MNGDTTISLPIANGLFNFRVAGVAVQNGRILLHKTETDNFWSLPGGRVEVFEFSKETLLREMMEETGSRVSVGKLIWVAENFFEYNGHKHHEVGFYYEMQFAGLTNQEDFTVTDGPSVLLFRWHLLYDLDQIPVYPNFISKELLSGEPSFSHFMVGFQDLHQSISNRSFTD